MEWNIEKSKKEDCKLIVEFITKVWSETYRGIINDNFLDSLKQTEEDRYINAINKFDEKNNMEYIIKENNEIIAFSKLAKTNDMHGKNIELQSLYVLKEYQNRGIGKKLIQNAFKKAKKLGYKKIIVGCLENNKSNDFYKKINGKYIGKREFKLPNQTLYENVYEYNI
ncbi:MAG: GNAT family N-acetyltransferase [Clostridia bacterium]|nr:GNAT family N-acetyltransferase [Clostridia bacterium]